MFSKLSRLLALALVLAFTLGGCSIYLVDLDKYFPKPPEQQEPQEPEEPQPPVTGDAPPTIEAIDVDPSWVAAGGTTRLTFTIRVSDPNGDFGRDKIVLRRSIRAIAGNIVFDETPRLLEVPFELDGPYAVITYIIDVDVPPEGNGRIQFVIEVADEQGNFSQPAYIELQVA